MPRRCNPAFLTLVVLLFITPVIAQDSDDDVIRVDSSIVVLNATITDNAGRSASGLDRKLFKVFEDGIEQQITGFTAESTPFAAVILLDSSGSMDNRMSIARSAAIRFLDGLRREDQAAIYNFESKVEMIQDFSNSRDIVERIFDLKADGYTVMNDAVYKAAALLSERPEKRRAIIVLSDGADNRSKHSANNALQAALSANATIYTIDMSSPELPDRDRMISRGALEYLAKRSGGTFVSTPGGQALRDAFQQIVDELGSQYTISYSPSNTKRDGKYRSIELRVARPNLSIRTRKGYEAPKD